MEFGLSIGLSQDKTRINIDKIWINQDKKKLTGLKHHPKLVATFIERDCRISSETSFACVLFEEHNRMKSNLKDHWGFTRYFFKFSYPTSKSGKIFR